MSCKSSEVDFLNWCRQKTLHMLLAVNYTVCSQLENFTQKIALGIFQTLAWVNFLGKRPFSMSSTALQTQNICVTFAQRQPNIFDVGPTLYNFYTNALCLMGVPWKK